jgi:hypothetical protein
MSETAYLATIAPLTALVAPLRFRIREELRLPGRFRQIRLFVPQSTFTSLSALHEELLANIPYPLNELPRSAFSLCLRPEEGQERGLDIRSDKDLEDAYARVQESRESGVGKLRIVLEDTEQLEDYLTQRR